MPVRPVFTCDVCGVRPDAEAQAALQRQMLDLRFGEYVDAEPGRWLARHPGRWARTRGRGGAGPTERAGWRARSAPPSAAPASRPTRT